jgi:hypothetical protein
MRFDGNTGWLGIGTHPREYNGPTIWVAHDYESPPKCVLRRPKHCYASRCCFIVTERFLTDWVQSRANLCTHPRWGSAFSQEKVGSGMPLRQGMWPSLEMTFLSNSILLRGDTLAQECFAPHLARLMRRRGQHQILSRYQYLYFGPVANFFRSPRELDVCRHKDTSIVDVVAGFEDHSRLLGGVRKVGPRSVSLSNPIE